MAKFMFTASIGYAGASREEEFEIPDEEFEGLTEEEINEYVEESYEVWLSNFFDGGWYRVEGE